MTLDEARGSESRDEELLAELFDQLLQDILEGRTPDLDALHPERPDLRERIGRTWRLACSVAGRREPSRPVLGGYEILRELGHGGMGTVYLARHQSLQRDVAIKVLPRSLAMSHHAKQRFLEEARALAQIRHENVVHVHRVVDHAEMLAFEMEFVDGPSLQDLIAKMRGAERPFATATLAAALGQGVGDGARSVVEWYVQRFIRLARALGVVHHHGLVHRDVKPANILLRRDGTPVLADFGLALAADVDGGRTRFAGTPVYAAPERLRGGDGGVDARTDVYSLGVTLYEALSNRAPYPGGSTHEVLRRIEDSAAPDLRQIAPHVPRDLALVVHKAMDPEPRRRYATADAFADDLERLLALQPIEAVPAGWLRRAAHFARRNRRVLAAAAAGAIAVAAVVWPLATHARRQQEAAIAAAQAQQAARTLLLSPAALPAAWSHGAASGRTLRSSQLDAARAVALQAAIGQYDAGLAAAPADERLRSERDAVAAVAAAVADEDAARSSRRAAGASATPAARFAAGLAAFLVGDQSDCRRQWSELPATWRRDPFLEACEALRQCGDGAHQRAYPRLFHAARSFPAAPALVSALAEAALATGDLAAARQHLAELAATTDPRTTATVRLLTADLLAAEGQRDEARRMYRQLVADDAADPLPLLRLADLAARDGDRQGGKRVLQNVLGRWPSLDAARRRLARMALEDRDLDGYLVHVRHAVAGLQAGNSDTLRELHAILRLGGLHELADACRRAEDDDVVAADAGVPLQAWLPAHVVRHLGKAALAVDAFERAHARATAADLRTVGALLLTPRLLLVTAPRLACDLPWPLLALASALPEAGPLLPIDAWSARLSPFQRALGSRFHAIADRSLLAVDNPGLPVVYANAAEVAGDVDGDGLDDLCIACVPSGPRTGDGRIEVRNLQDGALLRTLRNEAPTALFGRALATLGDVDGDHCVDVCVGSPGGHRADDAGVELWSGRTGALLWRAESAALTFGVAVAALGDVDDDGVRDVAVGEPPLRLASDARGAVAILSGRDGRELRRIDAPRGGVWFGAALAAVGDVDGDGRADLAIAGSFGGAPGYAAVHDPRTGARIAVFEDADAGRDFGASVQDAGDLDGDGRADLFVAAPARTRPDQPGVVLAFSTRSGKPLYELRGERVGDGFGAQLVRLPSWRRDDQPAIAVGTLRGGPSGCGYVRVFDAMVGTPLQTFAGNQGHARFGYTLVDLGDRNDDGLRDLGVVSLLRTSIVELYSVSFADIVFDVPPEPPKPR